MDYGGILFPKNKKNIHNDPLTGKTLLLLNLKKEKENPVWIPSIQKKRKNLLIS